MRFCPLKMFFVHKNFDKWNRAFAGDENHYAWTDEGRVNLRKSVLIFEKLKVLLVHCSSFGPAG